MTAGAPVTAPFDAVLTGLGTRLVRDDGVVLTWDPARWRAGAGPEDDWLLDRCTGPTVDLGCGPGRMVAALVGRGVSALGVDSSSVALGLCRRRGVPVVHRDVFARLPGEGGWSHVLLADGNIGIGGDPLRLLARAARLLRGGGTVLVETGPDPDEWWCGTARTCGTEVPWACVGAAALRRRAPGAGLRVVADSPPGERGFVELRRR
ncbi:class I SAM-dependent methyltransferase [Pseudonocardia sp. WMMC193]|uniref:class I SAM-dependent methyltransferase n=1 Tax=Pseudonocardia sp. WMMC193 TaxID=2911965 RepID=UPI0027DFFCA4|nr:class I SAM-dependent methyltransferase [Pseudonocardia sp. WMMC193]